MCAICDGAKSTSEMPCSKVLTRLGQSWQQAMGEGPATDMAFRATGGIPSISQQAREVQSSLLYGIHRGRAEEIQRERKQHRRDRLYAVGLTLFGVLLGWGIAQVQTTLFQSGG